MDKLNGCYEGIRQGHEPRDGQLHSVSRIYDQLLRTLHSENENTRNSVCRKTSGAM